MVAEPVPNEMDDNEYPTLHLSKTEMADLQAQVAAAQGPRRRCPVCGLANPPSRVYCVHCGSNLDSSKTPADLKPAEIVKVLAKQHNMEEVFVTDQVQIRFQIEGGELALPMENVVTVGRSDPELATVHVDLSPYGAEDLGLSRRHIQIRRENMLVYVTDLGSVNGTYLNGRRLLPHAERVLRNGDTLQLGRLVLMVLF